MRLSECIEAVNREKPNGFETEDLTRYVNEIEAVVSEYLEIPKDDKGEYDWKEDGHKTMLVPAPYDVLYLSFLKAKIDYANEEYESYSNNQAQFEEDLDEWKKYVVRCGGGQTGSPQIRNWW